MQTAAPGTPLRSRGPSGRTPSAAPSTAPETEHAALANESEEPWEKTENRPPAEGSGDDERPETDGRTRPKATSEGEIEIEVEAKEYQ